MAPRRTQPSRAGEPGTATPAIAIQSSGSVGQKAGSSNLVPSTSSSAITNGSRNTRAAAAAERAVVVGASVPNQSSFKANVNASVAGVRSLSTGSPAAGNSVVEQQQQQRHQQVQHQQFQLQQSVNEHQLFLQAFEKPTQIYRYLRTRHMVLPLFLQRTLTYMPKSAVRRSRHQFRVDSLLERALARRRLGPLRLQLCAVRDRSAQRGCVQLNMAVVRAHHSATGHVSKVFTHSCTVQRNQSAPSEEILIPEEAFHSVLDPTKRCVFTLLLVISLKKSASSSVTIGTRNGDDSFHRDDSAATNNGHCRQEVRGSQHSQRGNRAVTKVGHSGKHSVDSADELLSDSEATDTEGSVEDGLSIEQPSVKRRCILQTLTGELVIFDEAGQCQLSDGFYKVLLREHVPQNITSTHWVTVPPYAALTALPDETPSLELNLSWPDRHNIEDCPVTLWRKRNRLTPQRGQLLDTSPAHPTSPSKLCAFKHSKLSSQSGCEKNNGSRRTAVNEEGSSARSSLNPTATSAKTHDGSLNTNVLCTLTSATALSSIVQERRQTRVYYQFIYQSNSRQITEARGDLRCPWCYVDCRRLYSLLKHLKLCHSRFNFNYVPYRGGAKIDVTLNDAYDGSYMGNPQRLIRRTVAPPPAPSFLHSAAISDRGSASSVDGSPSGGPLSFPLRRTPITYFMVCRPQRPLPTLSEFLQDYQELELGLNSAVAASNQTSSAVGPLTAPGLIHHHVSATAGGSVVIGPGASLLKMGATVGHNRAYYHSHTCMPVKPEEFDYDSERENDPPWLREKTQRMLDEFTDVNEGEKLIMKMWNLHVMRLSTVADCHVPHAVATFVEKNGPAIMAQHLYRNALLHFSNLLEFGLISSSELFTSARRLQLFAPKNFFTASKQQQQNLHSHCTNSFSQPAGAPDSTLSYGTTRLGVGSEFELMSLAERNTVLHSITTSRS